MRIFYLDFYTISYIFLEEFKKVYDFEIRNDFTQTAFFLKRIRAEFNSGGRVTDYRHVEKILWQFLIIESNLIFKSTFQDYIQSLALEDNADDISHFIEAYSLSLADLVIPVEIFYNNTLQLLDLSQSDVMYNMRIAIILQGVKDKCAGSYSYAISLLQTVVSKEVVNSETLSAIVAGSYEVKGIEFYHQYLEGLIDRRDLQQATFSGLSTLSSIDESDAKLFIFLYDKFEGQEQRTLSVLQLLFTIIKSKDFNNKEIYASECFSRLRESVTKEAVVYLILHHLASLDNYQSEKVDLILLIIEQDYFALEKHLKPIELVFWYLKDIAALRLVVLKIITRNPFQSIAESFISAFSECDKSDVDRLLVDLLVDNDAARRFAGIEIFSCQSSHSIFKFDIDIIEFEPIIQYKLWVALSQSFKEPKYFLPSLLPLLTSKSGIVKESFICKLEELTEDYGSSIIEVLESYLCQNSAENLDVIKRVKLYLDNFYSIYIEPKREVKELNPFYTNNKQINYFNELFAKQMSGAVQKGSEENSLIGVMGISTIQLAKGGGWVMGNTKEISKLGTIGTSFSMPRSYFINPNKFEIERGLDMKSDWKDSDFAEIVECIKYEQQ